MEPQDERIVLVHEFIDYVNITRDFIHRGILGNTISMGVIIGCSGHSPIPAHEFDRVVTAVRTHVIVPNGVSHVWYGGDGLFRAKTRGGNIADVLEALVKGNHVHACAVQRRDWAERTPEFVSKIVSYDGKLAMVDGKKSFGGYEKTAPENFETFLTELSRTCISPEIIPKRKNIFPVGATAGYLLALPCMANRIILIVIPQAGFITFKEIEYVNLVLQGCPTAPIFVYAILWENMGDNLNNTEKMEKCKLVDIQKLLQNMAKKFPERVFFVKSYSNL